MMLKMTEINYDNFKNSLKETDRKKAYSNIWLELRETTEIILIMKKFIEKFSDISKKILINYLV